MKLVSKTLGATVATVALVALASGCETDTGGGKPASQKENGGNHNLAGPDNSSKGKGPLVWGNWEVVGRLQVTKEDFSGDFAVVTRVKNTGDSSDTGIFTVTILKGNNILGTADCTTPEIAAGSMGTASCFSTDNYKQGYTEVTIEDSF